MAVAMIDDINEIERRRDDYNYVQLVLARPFFRTTTTTIL
jgi:hypothetical protein